MASTAAKIKTPEKKSKPKKKKTGEKKALWGGSGFVVRMRQLGSSTGVSTGTGQPFRLRLPKRKKEES